MRVSALLILIGLTVASPAAAGPAPERDPEAASAADPATARFEKAVADTKAAMMADPGQALAMADKALAGAAQVPVTGRDRAIATAEWLKAEAYLFTNEPAKAKPLVQAALTRVSARAPNSKLHGDLMRSRGAIAATNGDVVEALRDYQSAYEIFRTAKEVRSQAIALQDIGQIYSDAADYNRALEYYSQATALYTEDPGFRISSHNNRAEVLRELGRFDEAERDYAEALRSARKLGSPLLQARILGNLAAAQVEHKRFAAAGRSVSEALHLARLAEVAAWKPVVLGAAAKLEAAQGNLPGAANLLRQAFVGMDLATTSTQFKEYHELAAKVFEELGDRSLALEHLKAFQRLDTESRNLTATTASQLMAARFDYQNQKQTILERDTRIEQQSARFRTTVLAGVAGAGGILLLLMLVSSLRIRRSRNQVRAANVVLNQTNLALEKALQAKTEFLATTSHEIRTPLNGILGMTQVLLTKRSLDSETREQVQVVHGAGEAMRALVDDILDVAKMETGEVAVVEEEVAFKALLEDVARLWGGHAEDKGIALKLEIEDAPAAISSDSARLRQIIGNLLSNAVKFTLEGSVTLRAFVTPDDQSLIVQVADTGIGIPEDCAGRVFEAFYQIEGGMNRQFSGTGLGLSICRNLATALRGTFTLESEVGTGSTFTLTLPLVRPTSQSGPAEGRVRPSSLADARLLLVEGNAMTEGVMRTILEPITASVTCVADGAAAIAAVRTGRVDHVLVEAKSSAIEGIEPLAALRALIEASLAVDMPVSVLIAPSEDYPLGDVAELGASQLIVKPVSGAQLTRTLTSAYAAEPLSSVA